MLANVGPVEMLRERIHRLQHAAGLTPARPTGSAGPAGLIWQVLSGADRETVVHEVFLRVLASAELRQRLTGESPAAWIGAIARNHAIDFRRRRGREVLGVVAVIALTARELFAPRVPG